MRCCTAVTSYLLHSPTRTSTFSQSVFLNVSASLSCHNDYAQHPYGFQSFRAMKKRNTSAWFKASIWTLSKSCMKTSCSRTGTTPRRHRKYDSQLHYGFEKKKEICFHFTSCSHYCDGPLRQARPDYILMHDGKKYCWRQSTSIRSWDRNKSMVFQRWRKRAVFLGDICWDISSTSM